MLNTWQWKKAIAPLLSAIVLLIGTGGLVSCGSNTADSEPETDEEINQNSNQRNESRGNNDRRENNNEQEDERDDDEQDEDDDDNN